MVIRPATTAPTPSRPESGDSAVSQKRDDGHHLPIPSALARAASKISTVLLKVPMM
jgi:hypothetical protein